MKTQPERILKIGCVADDFTGAADAASFLSSGGLNTLLLTQIPEHNVLVPIQSYDAVVIAQKTRSIPPAEAVAKVGAAFRWLSKQNTRQLYFKYCSTFDSTDKGNIGPVLDDLLETYRQSYTILCPALPINGRTVKNGELLVDGAPLHVSAMKNHPLTPMQESRLERLMSRQSRYPCFTLTHRQLSLPAAEIAAAAKKYAEQYRRFYWAVDYFTEEHGERIAELFGGLRLLSGGSGLLAPLGRRLALSGGQAARPPEIHGGQALILAGSCSQATLSQVETFIKNGGAAVKLEPERLLSGAQTSDDLWGFIERHRPSPALVYSSDANESVRRAQLLGKERVAAAVEKAMADLGRRAADSGFGALIVAGGETSGAVVQALGERAYSVGKSVAPGVPVLIPLRRRGLTLILKSGNFGAPDFFADALRFAAKGC